MHTPPCTTPSVVESMFCLEDTPPYDTSLVFIEELEPDNNLYTQREITDNPFDETQGPSTIFGSPPCDHSEIPDPQAGHNETPLLDNSFQGEPPAAPHGGTHPCLSSAMVPPLPCASATVPIMDLFPVPPTVCSTHMPHAAQYVPTPELDLDPDDQAVLLAPLPPGTQC